MQAVAQRTRAVYRIKGCILWKFVENELGLKREFGAYISS